MVCSGCHTVPITGTSSTIIDGMMDGMLCRYILQTLYTVRLPYIYNMIIWHYMLQNHSKMSSQFSRIASYCSRLYWYKKLQEFSRKLHLLKKTLMLLYHRCYWERSKAYLSQGRGRQVTSRYSDVPVDYRYFICSAESYTNFPQPHEGGHTMSPRIPV